MQCQAESREWTKVMSVDWVELQLLWIDRLARLHRFWGLSMWQISENANRNKQLTVWSVNYSESASAEALFTWDNLGGDASRVLDLGYYQWNESYHGHLNAEFNAPHPNIYIFVEVLLRQHAATYVTVSSLSKSRTIPRSIREKSTRLRELFTDHSAGLLTTCRLDYLQRVGYQFAPSS